MPNLTSLLSSYGLSAEVGAVWDEVEVKSAEEGENAEEAQTKTEWQSAVSVTINNGHDSMAMSDSEASQLTPVITGGNAISFAETDDSSLILSPILTTSEHASIEKDPDGQGEKVLAELNAERSRLEENGTEYERKINEINAKLATFATIKNTFNADEYNKMVVAYENAKLELIRLDAADIITTSEAMGDGEDFDDKAWT